MVYISVKVGLSPHGQNRGSAFFENEFKEIIRA
jgi:hypothetical protein